MHVSGLSLDLNWLLRFVVTAFFVALGLVHLVRNTASKYFVANFEGAEAPSLPSGGPTASNTMPGVEKTVDACVVCGNSATKKCSGCKAVRYCSQDCQAKHWKAGHKIKCREFQLSGKGNLLQSATRNCRSNRSDSTAPANQNAKILRQSQEILFPYEEFVELFNWDKPGFPPCGLQNCGNSCFANVVLQCLAHTRPLIAYLLERGHRRECRRNDWCFLCEFQCHVERASQSLCPFSPMNILSRLPNIGGNLGYGRQEDAHEFMRFAIDTMQSVCLDEFGGEKSIHPSSQETTLIQHIFGGHLQSQVICTKCNKVSNQYENMMDLTVEIHGDAASLEECLDQFTVSEWLHGENMYKCDGCNDYVKASKRLTIQQAPNILTIALKRFQSGRFGKLNKRVTFPETLNLTPYMSEVGDGMDTYKLYAVVVHVDMLNASYFGHYICYTKDFQGNWYRIDDCKVARVELEEVLAQGAYMLLYSRVRARPTCLKTVKPPITQNQQVLNMDQDDLTCGTQLVESITTSESDDSVGFPGFSSSSLSEPSPIEAQKSKCETLITNSNMEDGSQLESSGGENLVLDSIKENGIYETSDDVQENLVGKRLAPVESLQTSGLENLENGNSGKHTTTRNRSFQNVEGKLKPLFVPGFLGKSPRNKSMKREEKVLIESGDVSSAWKVNETYSNGFAKTAFCNKIAGEIKDQTEVERCQSEDEVFKMELDESVNHHNGDANLIIAKESGGSVV